MMFLLFVLVFFFTSDYQSGKTFLYIKNFMSDLSEMSSRWTLHYDLSVFLWREDCFLRDTGTPGS